MSSKTTVAAVPAVVGIVLIVLCPPRARGDQGEVVSQHGVSVWMCGETFSGDASFFQPQRWQRGNVGRLPRPVEGHPVIGTDAVLLAESGGTEWTVYTRHGDRLTPRAVLRLQPAAGDCRYRLVSRAPPGGLAVEVLSGDRLQYTLRLSANGLVELAPGEVDRLSVSQSRLAYAIVPSLVGVDLVYDPRDYADRRRLYVPSLNLLAGLVEGGDCMMAAVWPPGAQGLELPLARSQGGRPVVDGFSIALAGQSCYLRLIERPAIWHVEPLEPDYLEKNTAIGWKRPLEANWIGRFFVRSEDLHYPFYFMNHKERLWGRYIRGWYNYPLWFDKHKTYVHFEKKFPPVGELLIYYLDAHDGDAEVASPMGTMRQALGSRTAARLLDLDGIQQRPLLAHGDAVCAMTHKMQAIFDAGEEAKQRAYIESRADDVANFIEMIRDRVFEFGDFAGQLKTLLDERGQVLGAEHLAVLEEIVDEIGLATKEDLPDVSLEEVRRWTGRMKELARNARPSAAGDYKKLAGQCRSVAGTQDDLSRQLSILTIRLIERAAALGVDSAEQARLSEQVVARSRRVLRHPTWWEPRRVAFPKPDPGRPR